MLASPSQQKKACTSCKPFQDREKDISTEERPCIYCPDYDRQTGMADIGFAKLRDRSYCPTTLITAVGLTVLRTICTSQFPA